MNAIHTYPSRELPQGFKYPESFLSLIGVQQHPNIYPWEILVPETKVGTLALQVSRSGGRSFIPFAGCEDGTGDIACFRADPASADPLVEILIVDGSDRTYGFRNFEAWLEFAHHEAKKWSARHGAGEA